MPPAARPALAVNPRRPTAARCRGAVAVEFALVFPILFLLIYGTIVYSYVFILHESINYAAQEAAEAAVAVLPDSNGYDANVQARVRAQAMAVLSWLPAAQRERVLGAGGEKVEVTFPDIGGESAVQVILRFQLKDPTPIFPIINLPLVGDVPRLPDQISAQGVARV